MKYELQLFEQVISGELSPFIDVAADPNKYNRQINEKYKQCYTYTIASFKKTKDKFTLLDKTVMSSLHPLVDKVITPQQNLFHVAEIKDIAPEAFKVLQLDKQNIVSISYSQQPAKTLIYVKEIRQCSEIPFNEAKFYYYNDLLKTEVLRIKEAIKEAVFTNSAPGGIEAYIHNQHHSMINLCFSLMKMLDIEDVDIYKPAIEFTNTDILNLTYIKLEDLLRFLEKNYLNYIDKNIQVPYRSSLIKIYNTKEKLEFVKEILLSSRIEPDLLKIIYVPFLKLGTITLAERISYRELIYCNIYLDAFYQSIKENNNTIVESHVKKIVYQVNYNSLALQNYKVEIIKDNLRKLSEENEKIDLLYLSLKVINQRSSRLNISYDPGLPSLKEQVTAWVEEEINYLNKSIKINSAAQSIDLFNQDKMKLQSGLTVAQLAFFFKLQADVGIISHKIQRDIFRHIAENYQTSKVNEISIESIKNKYYQVDNGTIEAIKDKVIEILNQIKTH